MFSPTGEPGWYGDFDAEGDNTVATSIDHDTKNIWLFDIDKDPQEQNDLSSAYPDVVTTLLAKLAGYNATAVDCRYPALDLQSDPALGDGGWGPWET